MTNNQGVQPRAASVEMSASSAEMLAKAIIKDANRVAAIEGVFGEVQAICNRHRNTECAKEISALLTRKVW
jgi:hypothetical protein